jgi:1,4-dihydroxy-2-naphthoyl-CoA hydrolase
MKIWKQEFTLEGLNALNTNTLSAVLNMEFTEAGDDYLVAKMPVTPKHKQPMGLLHGGATAALAETIGSVASVLCLSEMGQSAVGVELNINHLSSATEGEVFATVRPIKIGRTIHVWDISIVHETGKPLSASRLTTMVRSLHQK